MAPFSKICSLFRGPDRVRAAWLLLLLVCAAGLETIGVGLVMPFIAVVTDPGLVERSAVLGGLHELLGSPSPNTFLIHCGLVLLLFYVAKNVFLAATAAYQHRFVYGALRRVGTRLLRAYLTAPYAYHLARNSAELQRNINHDTTVAFTWVVSSTFFLVSDLLVVVVLAGLLVVVNPIATLAALVGLGLVGGLYFKVVRARLHHLGEQEQAAFGEMTKWVNQGLGGIKETRVRGAERYFVEHYDAACDLYTRSRRRVQLANDLPRLLFETFAVGGVLAVMIVVLAGGGDPEAMIPLVALFAATAFRLLPALTRIVRGLNLIKHFRPSFDVVHRDLALIESVPDGWDDRAVEPMPFEHAIELRDIHFRYGDDGAPVLQGVSLEIPKNACVAFVGGSGSGKTTLVDLVLGLFRPQLGQVLADGRPIESDPAGWLRNFGYVPQEIYLTDDSIRRNVAFGVPDDEIDDEAVRRALASAQLADLLGELPGGLDHVVGEGGVRLSGGQRQRIGIARALYHDPPILVMDEATSALDARTEREINETTMRLSGSRTIVLIAHRLSTVERCDRLFLLQGGRLVAQGSYSELASTSVDFRRMAQLT